MALFLIDEDLDFRIELPLANPNYEAFEIQWQRCADGVLKDAFLVRVADQLSVLLQEGLDWDLQAPSEPQVKFATAIAREFGIAIPGEALRYRGSMGEFLTRWADTFRAAKTAAPRSPRPSPSRQSKRRKTD